MKEPRPSSQLCLPSHHGAPADNAGSRMDEKYVSCLHSFVCRRIGAGAKGRGEQGRGKVRKSHPLPLPHELPSSPAGCTRESGCDKLKRSARNPNNETVPNLRAIKASRRRTMRIKNINERDAGSGEEEVEEWGGARQQR